MLTFIIILLFGIVVLFDFLPIIKEKQKVVIWVYASLFIISFIILILYSLDIPVPGPTKLIEAFVERFFNIK